MNWFSGLIRRGRAPHDASPPSPGFSRSFGALRREGARDEGALPRFRASAIEQLNGTIGGPLGLARIRLRDAFTPSQPVADPRMFAGRGELLETVIRAIEDHRLHVVLFGDRGIGKTSLLHVLARQATEARYLVQYVSCGEEAEFEETFRAIAAEVPLLFHGGYAPNAAETERGQTLGDLLPPGPVTPRRVSELFGKLTGTRLLIILDEFDRSPSGQFRRQVAELVKNLSDRSVRVQLLIAGVAANLTELVEHIPSIRRNILGVAVPHMTAEEIGALVRNGERVSGVGFEPAALELVVLLSAGSPYIAGLLGQHAGITAVDRGSSTVAADDVEAAIERTVNELGDRISERSRFAIARAQADGKLDQLTVLAHAALRHGGRFDAAPLTDIQPDPNQREETLRTFASRYGLIEPIQGDPGERHRFEEEGVPTYLWMIAARDGGVRSRPHLGRAA